MAVPAIVQRDQDFHFPSEQETCLLPCRLSRHGSWGGAGGRLVSREPGTPGVLARVWHGSLSR